MKTFICAMLFVSAGSAHALDFEQEMLWRFTVAQMVAHQPAQFGWEKFLKSAGVDLKAAGAQELVLEAKAIKTWPRLSARGRKLVLEGENGKSWTIEPGAASGEVLLNGRALPFDFKVQRYLAFKKIFTADARTHRGVYAAFLLPDAIAQQGGSNWSEIGAASGIIGGGLVASYVAGVAAGTFGSAGTIMVAGGAASYCAGASVIKNGAHHGDSYSDRLLNCVTTPLSWLNKNPRDRLYLKDIQCPAQANDPLSVTLASASGVRQTRNFTNDEITLVSGTGKAIAVIKDSRIDHIRTNVGADKPEGRMDRGSSAQRLEEADALIRDREFYRGLCQDPAEMRRFQAALQSGRKTHRAYDQMSPDQMTPGAN